MRACDDPAAAAATAARERAGVLVVDAEPQIRDLLATALRRDGYEVVTCGDARNALGRIEDPAIGLLVTDLKMPRMDGLTLIRAAKDRRPDLASVLITAYASTETAVQALRHGADDYLTKPFSLHDLRDVVGRVLSARRLATDEQAAVRRVRDEATDLRRRHQEAEAELAQARQDLRLSRRELERRVRDLDFVRELTALLSRKGDLERVLQTTARILARRFDAHAARIELDLDDDVHVAEHQAADLSPPMLKAMGADLVRRARHRPGGALQDLVLGFGAPLEALAASVDVDGRPAGGIVLLRPSSTATDAVGDRHLLSLVPQALGVAVESELGRRRAERNALRVAERMLQVLEGRGALHVGHAERVARLSGAIAGQLGLPRGERELIETAARLHDVGEVAVPDGVLQREGPLSDVEREIVETHPIVGASILEPLVQAAALVRHHHERPDGTGYPDRLSGDAIPIGAGIIGVAEAFDAMTSPRPYRPSRSRREAREEVARLRGVQFVAAAADGLLALPPERL